MAPIRVLLVEDHALLASAIVEVLDVPEVSVVAVARTGAEVALLAKREMASVLLLSYHLPDIRSTVVASLVREASPETAIVFHTADDSEEAILDAIDAGAIAYLTRSATAEQFVEAIQRAARGEVLIPVALFASAIARQTTIAAEQGRRDTVIAGFTPRELEILRGLAQGIDTWTMATQFGIAPHTIEWHVRHVIEKLHVHSQLQAVVAAVRLGIIQV